MRAPTSPRHTHTRVWVHVDRGEERVRVTKGQGKGRVACAARIDAHVRACAHPRETPHTRPARVHTRPYAPSFTVSSAARASPRPPNLFQVSHFVLFPPLPACCAEGRLVEGNFSHLSVSWNIGFERCSLLRIIIWGFMDTVESLKREVWRMTKKD